MPNDEALKVGVCGNCSQNPCECETEARTPVTPQADHERLSPNEWEAIARHLEQYDLPRTAERVRAVEDQLERNAEVLAFIKLHIAEKEQADGHGRV